MMIAGGEDEVESEARHGQNMNVGKISDASKSATTQAISSAKKCNCTLERTFTKMFSPIRTHKPLSFSKVQLHFLVRAPTSGGAFSRSLVHSKESKQRRNAW
jgi:hypothetical protein